MSYRSFKRVLGETSLERKCRFLFGACLLVLIAGSFYLYGKKTEEIVDKQNPIRGRLLVDTILALVHWEKFEQNDAFKPVIRDLSATWQVNKYDWSFIRPNYVASGRQSIDEFERKFLRLAEQGPPLDPKPGAGETSEEKRLVETSRPVDGGKQFEYYQGVYAAHSCVGCHSAYPEPRDLTDGDLLAIARVRISNGPTQANLNLNRAYLLSSAIVTVFLAMVASWIIVRYVIVKPLKHLRDVSDEISKGDLAQRADIHTGDEFEALATAFNRMLRNLVETQQDLQRSNTALDTKVDELAQANMQLFELNRLKSDFLATMSHELRTPLNSIIGFSDVLGGIASLDDKQRRYVQNIKKSGKVLLDMINDILDLAKIDSGKMELRPVEFSLESLLHAQCDVIRPLSEKKNIDLTVEVEPTDEPLFQDAAKLQQVLNNLLSNAVKFTPEGGRIQVTARRAGDGRLELVVSDTGVGIAEEDRTAIFEKFRQGSAISSSGDAMTREYSGTGLGLSIVKELCKLLGGEVTVESELGKGSVFTVHVPWNYRPPRPEPRADQPFDPLTSSQLAGGNGEHATNGSRHEPSIAPGPSLGIGDP
jgi:two-component system sensor histidine kinase BarA